MASTLTLQLCADFWAGHGLETRGKTWKKISQITPLCSAAFTSTELRQADRLTLLSYLHHLPSKLPHLQTHPPRCKQELLQSWRQVCQEIHLLLFVPSFHLSCPHTLPQIIIPQGTMKKYKCQYRSLPRAICKRRKQSCFYSHLLCGHLEEPDYKSSIQSKINIPWAELTSGEIS